MKGAFGKMRYASIILAALLLGACTTKFNEPADSDAEGDVLPDGVDGDVDGPGDADAEDTVPDVECEADADCNVIGENYICCDRVCVDGSSDPRHCGSCTNVCGDGLYCCDGACRDTVRDPDYCGSCDTRCDIGSVCSGGTCIACTADTIEWPAGDLCYIDTGLGRFSHYSVLAPIFDGRMDRVPEVNSPLHNPPLFGVLTVDNVPVESADTLRDYVVQVRRWRPDGTVDEAFVKPYAGVGRGILALDALHLPRPDLPGSLLVTLGGARTREDAARSDDLFIDTVDLAPDSTPVEAFYEDAGSGDIVTPGVYWQLPVPFEAVLSLAGIGGGAVVGVGSSFDSFNMPAAAIKRAPTAGDAMMEWVARAERYAYASHVAVGNDRIFVLVTDDSADSANPINANYDVRLYCYNSPGIDLAGPTPAMIDQCWGMRSFITIAGEAGIDEVGLAVAAGAEGTAYVVYEENSWAYKITRVDPDGDIGAYTDILVDSPRSMAVSALLVDNVRNAVFVVGYHYDLVMNPNHQKTPAIWKLSDGLGVITDFGTDGRKDCGEGFFSDALLLCDGSILAKIYHDAWNQPAENHADDSVCLVRYSGGTGEPF